MLPTCAGGRQSKNIPGGRCWCAGAESETSAPRRHRPPRSRRRRLGSLIDRPGPVVQTHRHTFVPPKHTLDDPHIWTACSSWRPGYESWRPTSSKPSSAPRPSIAASGKWRTACTASGTASLLNRKAGRAWMILQRAASSSISARKCKHSLDERNGGIIWRKGRE